MTAALATSQPAKLNRAVDARFWIPLAEAARILGVTEGSLRLRCDRALQAAGNAMKVRSDQTGKVGWFVRRAIDKRLLPGSAGESHQLPDLSRFTKRQLDTMLMRKQCVDRFRDARANRPGLMKDWLPSLVAELRDQFPAIRISTGSLWRWHRECNDDGDIEKLIDHRGGDQKSKGDPAAWSYFEKLYLRENGLKAADAWRRTREHCRAAGLQWPSYKSTLRELERRVSMEDRIAVRDPRRWRSQLSPYAEQHPERFAAGQCWVGDHRPLDMMCGVKTIDGYKIVRPFITAWQDWRTRRVYADLFVESNSSTILSVLRSGLMDRGAMGGPSIVWIDNGKDFDCYSFHGQTKQQRLTRVHVELDESSHKGLFGLLAIEPHFALAYNPTGKARMERWFGTVGQRFDRSFDTYTGNTPANKPEQLKELVKDPAKVPAFEHVRQRFRAFIAGFNASAEHTIQDMVDSDGTRLSPDEAMRRWCTTRRVMADPAALELCLMKHHKPVTVGRNGISIQIAGQRLVYGYMHPALSRFKGTKQLVHVAYDPDDVREIRVFDQAWAFVTDAALNELGGTHDDPIAEAHVREYMRRRNAYRRARKAVDAGWEHEVLTHEELIAQTAAKAAAAQAPTETRAVGMKLVQTPLDGQSRGVRREHIRKAAGAEHDAFRADREPVGRGLPALSKISELGNFEFDPDDSDGSDDARGDDLPSLTDLAGGALTRGMDDDTEDGISPWGRYAAQHQGDGP